MSVWLALLVCPAVQAQAAAIVKQAPRAIYAIVKHPHVLPEGEIIRLAELGSKAGGTKDIGRHLGSLKLPGSVLEDTYLRIAMKQGTISRAEAEGMMARLHDVPGFRSTLSKIVGASGVKTKGHLHELRLSDNAAANGFKVEGIGISFQDINKAGVTDIDVILARNGRIIAIEAKDYSSGTLLPMDAFRADMDTLSQFAKINSSTRIIKIFSMTNKPMNHHVALLLSKEANRRGVHLIYGSSSEQIQQIRQLEKLL